MVRHLLSCEMSSRWFYGGDALSRRRGKAVGFAGGWGGFSGRSVQRFRCASGNLERAQVGRFDGGFCGSALGCALTFLQGSFSESCCQHGLDQVFCGRRRLFGCGATGGFRSSELVPDDETPEPEAPAPVTAAAADQSDVIRQLQERVLELEAKEAAGPQPHPYLGDRELFPGQCGSGQPGALDGATWAKLQALAGPPPARLGRGEHRPTTVAARPSIMFAKQAEAEVSAEVVAEDELETLTQAITDPMQKLLAMQLRQQQALLTRLAPKSSGDALYAALGGGGNESGSSTGSIRGCAARELFIKQVK